MPALLKGFLDRVLAPGFAFEDHEHGPGWRKLVRGKTADLITTIDTPGWIYRWIYRAPGHNAMRRAILGFCGIDPTAWLLSLPLLLAILPGITVAGVPDHDADRAAAKGTLAVRFGVRAACWIAGGATLVSAAAALVLQRSAEVGALLGGIEYIVLTHATCCYG